MFNFINHLNKFKYAYMSCMVLLLICTYIIIIGKFKFFSLSSLICITFIIIILVHIIVQLLIDKGLNTSNVHLVLWIGLISTFIGFTLSTFATEMQKEQSDKQRLVGLLNLTEGLANQRMEAARVNLRFSLLEYKENKQELNLMPVDIPVTSVFSTMKEDGYFISFLSEDFVMRVF